MKASHAWLRELSGIDASPAEMAERLTRAGLEVEGITAHGAGLEHIVIAEVRGKRPHPKRDKLTLVSVFDGTGEREIVCGAPNVPEAGAKVLVAQLGARLPNGMEIAARDVAGVPSTGMLCSEAELGIGSDDSGIVVLERGVGGRVGAPIVDALGLRDHVLELSLTPNRPDCLGHVGLARELSLLFGKPFVLRHGRAPQRLLSADQSAPSSVGGLSHLPVVDPEQPHPGDTLSLVQPFEGVPLSIPIAIRDAERCTRYLGLVLQHVSVKPSPFWMRHRLHVLGQRSIDAVVDATNWILLETGHPIHAFDLDTLHGPAIVVRTARDGETLVTLDGVERTLSTDDLVIADSEVPVALAGVMGGKASGVSAKTRSILLEVAYFDPRSVRRTGRRHGLHTEASHRFERGCDPNALEHVLRRAASVLASVAEAAAAPDASDALARRVIPAAIHLRTSHPGQLLGVEIPISEARTTLEGVGCTIAPAEEGGWRVTAPTQIGAVGRPEDLIEEIARVHGYDRIPATMAPLTPKAAPPDRTLSTIRALREAATDAGLFEAVSFSFLSRRELELARAPGEVVELANPMSEERSVMRTSLLPGLLGAVARAQRHQAPRASLFELGRTYHPVDRAESPRATRERTTLAIVLSGPRRAWIGDEAAFDFYDGKGAIETILRAVGLRGETVVDDAIASAAPWAHPRRAARVRAAGTSIGVLAELHPDVAEGFELSGRPVVAVLDVEAILALARNAPLPQSQPLPRFPSVLRDLAVVVPEETTAGDVIAAIRGAASLAERVELFDVYRGKPVPEGRKSLAFRIGYRDPEATLTDARVEQVHGAVVAAIADRFGGALRS